MEKKYYIQTFGCQMNDHESEQMALLLEEAGYDYTSNALKADVIILNTCSIREKAAQKVYSQLGRFQEYKRRNPRLVIGVGGCLAQQWGKKFFKKAPYLDLVFGTHNIHRLPNLIQDIETGCSQIAETDFLEASPSLGMHAAPRGGRISAYATIMQGCNNFCSYCVVPYLRGPEVSRPMEDIIVEVESFAAKGIKEVTLLGQNVNSYGKTFNNGVNFSLLLKHIDKISGIERIRFTTSHPKDLTFELMNSFADVDKLCEHIHLPFQSGSDHVLERMNRGYSKKDYQEKVARLRSVCPKISITSDVIVGFPGETDKDFQETIYLMEEIRFDNLFSFKYSEREGTTAANYDGKVSERLKSLRLQTVQSLQEKHAWEKNKAMLGQREDVLVEGKSKNSAGEVMGRTRTNMIVNFKGSFHLVGKIISVIITDAYLHSLHAELPSMEGD